MILHNLLSICSTYFHDSRHSGADSRQGQVVRSAGFGEVFRIVFRNVNFLTSFVSAPAYAILSDVLNNDSSPPGILVHLIGNSGFHIKLLTSQIQ